MGKSHYQSLFRRARGDEKKSGFTRDYLQASGIQPVLLEMFEDREPPYELTYRWGSGSDPNGRIFPAADYDLNRRVEVGQFLGGVPPLPWRIGDPSTPEITLPGDPDAAIPDAAVAQWEDEIAPMEPWLMMVQLDGDQDEMHLRAYLGSPRADLQDAALERVPAALRDAMTGPSRSAAGALATDLPELWFDPDDFRNPWRTAAPESDGEEAPSTQVAPSSPPPKSDDDLGSLYRPADEDVSSATPEPFDVDPDERDRSTGAHNETQNALADIVRARGLEPRSPQGEPNFDIAWEEPDGRQVVIEVKSLSERNAERQMRLGLGQVLRYRNILAGESADVVGVLALSAEPCDPRWMQLCEELGVGLIWRPDLEDMLAAWLG